MALQAAEKFGFRVGPGFIPGLPLPDIRCPTREDFCNQCEKSGKRVIFVFA
jgi:hypothetical protein